MARKALMVIIMTALLVIAPLTASGTLAVDGADHSLRAATTADAPSQTDVEGTVGDLGPGLALADLRDATNPDATNPDATNPDASKRDASNRDAGNREGSMRGGPTPDVGTTQTTNDRAAPGDEPVLLVHGFADTGYTPWWVEMTDDLGDAGYEHGEVFVLNLGAIPGSTIDSPEDYGEAVCDAIETVQAETGAGEVDIVAHSMGGLDARHCIEKQGGAENVDDLVTLGTPHQGTYVAYLAYITPGARDMVPGSDFLRDLNDGQLAASVEYTAVWSDWDELINPDEYAKLPAEERNSVPNARNVFVDNTFHVQLVWDDDVFDAWIDRLD